MTTGNGFPAECYAVFKIMWYRDNEPEMFAQAALVLGSKDYINLRLTGRPPPTSPTPRAAGVYDLLDWDYQRGVHRGQRPPRAALPGDRALHRRPRHPHRGGGRGAGPAAQPCRWPAAAWTTPAWPWGRATPAEGRVYTSLGSSSWIAVSSAKPVLDPVAKPYVFTHVVPGLFTSAVSIFSGGSSFRWIRDVAPGRGADRAAATPTR